MVVVPTFCKDCIYFNTNQYSICSKHGIIRDCFSYSCWDIKIKPHLRSAVVITTDSRYTQLDRDVLHLINHTQGILKLFK